jgi:hypothetical protein
MKVRVSAMTFSHLCRPKIHVFTGKSGKAYKNFQFVIFDTAIYYSFAVRYRKAKNVLVKNGLEMTICPHGNWWDKSRIPPGCATDERSTTDQWCRT